ncbi:MAG TPA: M56 family metallopeptidase [Puia sp.]|uniref:M56 family metallopeptidase n=1 Tax=Puia sp. TaxID=2045100 RepID=UPI002C891CFF|nr:M56 family metallopeptidase [Puia sp.]HVU96617.1 M56 family metallopeptidase [Puia sp.]
MHLLTQSALLQALGWTLVNSLWQMALLWFCYLGLTRLFHSAPSHFRHGLALTLLGFGALGSIVTFTGAYFFDAAGWGVGQHSGWDLLSSGAWGTGNRLMAAVLPWCSALYLLILALLLVRYSHQYIYSWRLSCRGLTKVPAEFRVFVASTRRLMGIRREVKAWLSTRVDVPVTLGHLKPIILLPAAMIAHLTTEQVEAILVHELAHIRRRDYLVNLLVTIVELIFFFNPFSRLLIRQLQKEREHSCDDEVLQFRYEPHAYVSALLSLARQHRQGRLALAATGGDDQLLLQRARKILQQKRTDRRPGARPFVLLFLTAAITILSLSAPTRQQPLAVRRPQTAAPLQGELAFNPIIINKIGAPVVAPSVSHPKSKAGDHPSANRTRHQEASQDEGDENTLASVASADAPQAAGVFTQPATLTIIAAPTAKRDNSLGKGETGGDDEDNETATDLPPMDNLVFVPNSSFSFKIIDTLRPEDKLTWIEESTEKEIRGQVMRLQSDLKAQLALLRSQEAQARSMANASQLELKKLLNQQIQIQQMYLKKLDELHNRIRKTRRLTTVYI